MKELLDIRRLSVKEGSHDQMSLGNAGLNKAV